MLERISAGIAATGLTNMDNYKLTALDIKAIRQAEDICVHLNARHPNGLVRLIKRASRVNQPFAQDAEHVIPCAVKLVHSERLQGHEAECFAIAGIYHSQVTPLSSALKTLREGDELRFYFQPDYHTTGHLYRADIHGDALMLEVYRGPKHAASWEIDARQCPNNSARMCKWCAFPDHYKTIQGYGSPVL